MDIVWKYDVSSARDGQSHWFWFLLYVNTVIPTSYYCSIYIRTAASVWARTVYSHTPNTKLTLYISLNYSRTHKHLWRILQNNYYRIVYTYPSIAFTSIFRFGENLFSNSSIFISLSSENLTVSEYCNVHSNDYPTVSRLTHNQLFDHVRIGVKTRLFNVGVTSVRHFWFSDFVVHSSFETLVV